MMAFFGTMELKNFIVYIWLITNNMFKCIIYRGEFARFGSTGHSDDDIYRMLNVTGVSILFILYCIV